MNVRICACDRIVKGIYKDIIALILKKQASEINQLKNLFVIEYLV